MPLHILSFVLLFSICYGADIEKYLKVCNRNSPDVNDCLVDAIQHGIGVVADGIKEMGVPPTDPYHQKELRFDYKRNQIHAKMAMKEAWVRGNRDSTVRDVRFRSEDDSFHLEIDMFSPFISVDGTYEGSGSYNDLNITAYGAFGLNMTDLVYTWKLDGKPETIDNDVYIRIKSFYMRPDVSGMTVFLSNESPSSKELTDLGIKLVNDNWRILYKEFLPYAQSNWNKIGVKVANQIFLKTPYNELFPNKS